MNIQEQFDLVKEASFCIEGKTIEGKQLLLQVISYCLAENTEYMFTDPDNFLSDTPPNNIIDTFLWSNSIEGHYFWMEVHKKAEKLMTSDSWKPPCKENNHLKPSEVLGFFKKYKQEALNAYPELWI